MADQTRPALPTYIWYPGFWMAVIVALVTGILWGMGMLPKEHALVILAICAVRL